MTRDEDAYTIKLRGQLLAHTTRASPQEVFDEFPILLKAGGKIVQVVMTQLDERPCFRPTAYLFSNSDKSFFFGAIDYKGEVTNPQKIEPDHPVIGIVKKASNTRDFTCDAIFLFELDEDGSAKNHGVIRRAISFVVTEDGDTTSVSKLIQKSGIKPVVNHFLENFNLS